MKTFPHWEWKTRNPNALHNFMTKQPFSDFIAKFYRPKSQTERVTLRSMRAVDFLRPKLLGGNFFPLRITQATSSYRIRRTHLRLPLRDRMNHWKSQLAAPHKNFDPWANFTAPFHKSQGRFFFSISMFAFTNFQKAPNSLGTAGYDRLYHLLWLPQHDPHTISALFAPFTMNISRVKNKSSHDSDFFPSIFCVRQQWCRLTVWVRRQFEIGIWMLKLRWCEGKGISTCDNENMSSSSNHSDS